jgi:tRNA/rRNA methyltransferase
MDDTRFILLNTSHPGNVGATARAMKVMGFRDLVLVAPRFADVRLSGSIEAGDVQAFVTAVRALLPLQAVKGDDGSVSLTD